MCRYKSCFFIVKEYSSYWTICNHYRPNDDDGYYYKIKLSTIEKGEGVICILIDSLAYKLIHAVVVEEEEENK